jgi:8-oxo-dGTP pyrophosphatase MutT (NUDIX family)
MVKSRNHLSHLAVYAEAMLNGGTVEQVGALCYRVGPHGQIEVLLLTTRETGRWTIPKGWPIKGLKPHEAAEREAWEEAGVRGKAQKKPHGFFTYLKTLHETTKVPAMVEVHLLEVSQVSTKFPESKQRSIEWMSPIEAATRVQELELKGLLSIMGRQTAM